MKWLEFLRAIRCPLCLKRRQELGPEYEWAICDEKEHGVKRLILKMDSELKRALGMIKKREGLIKQERSFMEEKEEYLRKFEEELIREKESLLGKDGAEIKRKILLPAMQQRWVAEKNKIDAERTIILKTTPKIKGSLELKIEEMRAALNCVKKKPHNTANHDLLVGYQNKLEQMEEIVAIIDKERMYGSVHQETDIH